MPSPRTPVTSRRWRPPCPGTGHRAKSVEIPGTVAYGDDPPTEYTPGVDTPPDGSGPRRVIIYPRGTCPACEGGASVDMEGNVRRHVERRASA